MRDGMSWIKALTGAVVVLGAQALPSHALPFNQDMVNNQLSGGQIMRPKAAGSIQDGALERFVGTREEAAKLTNPVPATAASVGHGQRIYNSNCAPCHGQFVDNAWIPGPVGKVLPAVNLSQDYLKKVPDSHFFQFIHFGGMAIMPAYGWKLSMNEHWDVVNYIRSVQNHNPSNMAAK